MQAHSGALAARGCMEEQGRRRWASAFADLKREVKMALWAHRRLLEVFSGLCAWMSSCIPRNRFCVASGFVGAYTRLRPFPPLAVCGCRMTPCDRLRIAAGRRWMAGGIEELSICRLWQTAYLDPIFTFLFSFVRLYRVAVTALLLYIIRKNMLRIDSCGDEGYKKGRAFRLFLRCLPSFAQYLRLRAASAFFLRFTLGFS